MNSTEKMELHIEENQDGSASVQLTNNEQMFDKKTEDLAQILEDAADANDNDGGEEVDPDRLAIREARREERQLKKQLHRQKATESNHLIAALKKQNQQLAERVAVMEHKTSGAELARMDKAIEDAAVQVEYAKMKMRDSVNHQNGDELTNAQEMWFDSKRKLESLQSMKDQATRNASQPKNIQGADPVVQRLAAEWMEQNPWYDPQGKDLDSEIASKIDKKLTEEGFDPKTEEYWEELDTRIGKYLPEKNKSGYNNSNVRNQRPRSMVASSGRESIASTRGTEFRLSPERVAAMKEAGLWNNAESRRKATEKYAIWDRANKNQRS